MRRVLSSSSSRRSSFTAAWWLALIPGTVTAEIGTFVFEADTPVFALGLLAGFIILYLVIRLIRHIIFMPRPLGAGGKTGGAGGATSRSRAPWSRLQRAKR